MTIDLTSGEITTLQEALDLAVRQGGIRNAAVCLPLFEKLASAVSTQNATQNAPTGHSERMATVPEAATDL